MPEPQDTWVRNTPALDPAAYADPPGGPPPGQSQPPDMQGLDTDESILASLDLAFRELARQRQRLAQAGIDTKPLDTQIATFQATRDKAKADPEHRRRHVSLENLRHDALRAALDAGDDAEAQLKSTGKGTNDAIADLCAAAAKQVEKVPKGKSRDILDQRLASLQDWIEDVAKEPDPKRRKLAIEDIDLEAQSLLKAAAKQTGDKKAVQAAFAEALKDKYGFDISNAIGTPNTHLDHIYALFEKMPVGHVAQTKLDISALHEFCHSVDDRWGIMKAHGSKPNCGAWNDESVDTPTEAALATLQVPREAYGALVSDPLPWTLLRQAFDTRAYIDAQRLFRITAD